jgi:ribosomal protein S18 acetylase RimI-like enzyme
MIVRLDSAPAEDLKEALPRFAHKPLAHLSYLRRDQVDAYSLDEINQDLADESSIAFVSRISERINGLVLYGDSPWDTKVVGRRVAAIKHLTQTHGARDWEVLDGLLEEAIRDAAKRGVECLTCKVQALHHAEIHALERQGFFLMDTLLDFLFDSSRTPLESIRLPKRPNGSRIRLAKPEDLPEILALTEKAFATHFGRYHSDPKMPVGTGARVYEQWVRSSFEGWADWILVAEVDGRIAGYAVWKKASALEIKHSFDIAHCNLEAIHPDFFGRGLYTALTLEGMRIGGNFAKHFDLPAHAGNYPVHRGTLKLGWKISGVRHSFHKWLQA